MAAAFKLETTTDISEVTPEIFAKFTTTDFATLTKIQAQGLTANLLAVLTTKTIDYLSPQLKNISGDALMGIDIKIIPNLSISTLSTDQVNAFTTSQKQH